MKRTKVDKLLNAEAAMEAVLVQGWVRTRRSSKNFSFIEINDGSCLKGIQAIADDKLENYADIEKLTTGSAVSVTGKLVESPGKGQKWEVQADSVTIVGLAPED